MSNQISNINTHKIRADVDAILIGTNTAVTDNPSLSTRNFPGSNAIRIVLDRKCKIPQQSHIFDGSQKTIVIHNSKTPPANSKNIEYIQFDMSTESYLADLLDYLYEQQKHKFFTSRRRC